MRQIAVFLLILLGFHAHAERASFKTSTREIPLETLRGKWIFISYWATWCPPCLDEIDVLNQFHQSHQKEDVVLFAVNYDGLSPKEQIALAKTHKLQYPSLIEDPAISLNLGDIPHLPAMFVFNPKGQLQDKQYGEQTLAGLNHYFLKLKKDFAQAPLSTQRAYKPSV